MRNILFVWLITCFTIIFYLLFYFNVIEPFIVSHWDGIVMLFMKGMSLVPCGIILVWAYIESAVSISWDGEFYESV